MTETDLTRRNVIALAGGTAAAGLAGCLGDDGQVDDHGEEHVGIESELTVYVAVYHWGFTAFDETGEELDVIEIEPNTELTIQAVNDHAYDAFEALPDPVATQLEDFDALERTKQKVEAGELPEPDGATVEEVYEKAHGHGHGDDDHHDDGHGDDDHHDDGHGDDDHHDDGHGDDDHHDDGHGDDDHHDDGHGDDDHGHDHDDATLDHGFSVRELGIQMQVPWDKDEPVEQTVVVEEPGTYEARCIVGCGYYHTDQVEELIEVTG